MSEVSAVLFKNFTNEEFVCSWDSIPYKFPPGREMYMEDWKAAHFAKHLVNREINKMGGITSNQSLRAPLEAKALPTDNSVEVAVDDILDTNMRNSNKNTKSSTVVEEDEFATVNN